MPATDNINLDSPHGVAILTGADLGAFNRRLSRGLSQMFAILGSYAKSPEVTKNTFALTAEAGQTMGYHIGVIGQTPGKVFMVAVAEVSSEHYRNVPESSEQDTGISPQLKYGMEFGIDLENISSAEDIQRRKPVEPSDVIAQQEDDIALSPILRGIESPTANENFIHIYESAIRYFRKREISECLDVIAQREDNWDGLESNKPIQSSLVHAKRLIEKLLDDILYAGYSWRRFKPLISSDEDGYITIRWIGEGKRLHFQFKGKEVEYITLERIKTKRKMGGDTIRDDNCFEIWEWLING